MYIYITTNLVVKDVINKYMSRTSYILGKKKSYKNYCLSTVTFLIYPSSSYFSWFCLFWFFSSNFCRPSCAFTLKPNVWKSNYDENDVLKNMSETSICQKRNPNMLCYKHFSPIPFLMLWISCNQNWSCILISLSYRCPRLIGENFFNINKLFTLAFR